MWCPLYFKMAQNCCDRNRPRDWICIQTSKWANYLFPFVLGNFEISISKKHKTSKWPKSSKWIKTKEKKWLGHFEVCISSHTAYLFHNSFGPFCISRTSYVMNHKFSEHTHSKNFDLFIICYGSCENDWI